MKNTHITKLAAVLLTVATLAPVAQADDAPNSARNQVLRAAMNSGADLRAVLDKGISVDATDDDRETALMEAADRGNLTAVVNLISAGANVNARDDDGETALMIAADEGHTKIVEVLIAAGADVNARDEDGETALQKARKERHRAAAAALQAAGAH